MSRSHRRMGRRLVALGLALFTSFAPSAPLPADSLAGSDPEGFPRGRCQVLTWHRLGQTPSGCALRTTQEVEQRRAPAAQPGGLEEILKTAGRQAAAWLNAPAAPTAPAAGLEENWSVDIQHRQDVLDDGAVWFEAVALQAGPTTQRLARALGLDPGQPLTLVRPRTNFAVEKGENKPFFVATAGKQAVSLDILDGDYVNPTFCWTHYTELARQPLPPTMTPPPTGVRVRITARTPEPPLSGSALTVVLTRAGLEERWTERPSADTLAARARSGAVPPFSIVGYPNSDDDTADVITTSALEFALSQAHRLPSGSDVAATRLLQALRPIEFGPRLYPIQVAELLRSAYYDPTLLDKIRNVNPRQWRELLWYVAFPEKAEIAPTAVARHPEALRALAKAAGVPITAVASRKATAKSTAAVGRILGGAAERWTPNSLAMFDPRAVIQNRLRGNPPAIDITSLRFAEGRITFESPLPSENVRLSEETDPRVLLRVAQGVPLFAAVARDGTIALVEARVTAAGLEEGPGYDPQAVQQMVSDFLAQHYPALAAQLVWEAPRDAGRGVRYGVIGAIPLTGPVRHPEAVAEMQIRIEHRPAGLQDATGYWIVIEDRSTVPSRKATELTVDPHQVLPRVKLALQSAWARQLFGGQELSTPPPSPAAGASTGLSTGLEEGSVLPVAEADRVIQDHAADVPMLTFGAPLRQTRLTSRLAAEERLALLTQMADHGHVVLTRPKKALIHIERPSAEALREAGAATEAPPTTAGPLIQALGAGLEERRGRQEERLLVAEASARIWDELVNKDFVQTVVIHTPKDPEDVTLTRKGGGGAMRSQLAVWLQPHVMGAAVILRPEGSTLHVWPTANAEPPVTLTTGLEERRVAEARDVAVAALRAVKQQLRDQLPFTSPFPTLYPVRLVIWVFREPELFDTVPLMVLAGGDVAVEIADESQAEQFRALLQALPRPTGRFVVGSWADIQPTIDAYSERHVVTDSSTVVALFLQRADGRDLPPVVTQALTATRDFLLAIGA